MRVYLLLSIGVVGATRPTAAQATLPAPPGAHVVTISRPEQRGAEPAIALDIFNPSRLIAGFGGPVIAYSTDSGRTFATADGTAPEGWRGGGDVTLTYDDKGAAYLSYLTFDGLGTPSYWAHNAKKSAIWVRRSPDGGRTWEKEPALVKQWPNESDSAPQMVDMSRIWADVSPRSPHRGNLYVGWINWELDKSVIQFSRSTDRGHAWSKPVRISTHAGLPRDDNGGLVGVIGAVGADGRMYVIWNDLNSIAFTTSRDGGRTFAPSRKILDVGPVYFGGATGVPGVARVMGFAQIAVDRRGALYVTWSDFTNGDVDVYLSRSVDAGRTWTRAVRVNDDPAHDGNDQFFQWLAVDPINGDVYVQFYDRRGDPENRKTRVTLARSTDGGRRFVSYNWSGAPFEGENVFLGDYSWLTAYDGRVYGTWVEALPPDSASAGGRPRQATAVKVGTADFRSP